LYQIKICARKHGQHQTQFRTSVSIPSHILAVYLLNISSY